MIYIKVDLPKYKEEFKKKFNNFGNKAPIVFSFAMDDSGVTVVHENTGTRYHYEWDPTIPVKDFIHIIKKELSFNHYPRICRDVIATRPITPEEVANRVQQGENINDMPSLVDYVKREVYRIDKIITMKDEFILINEDTGEQYCYRMKNSGGIYFLRNYRNGEFKDPKEAGDYFFEKSELVSKLTNINLA